MEFYRTLDIMKPLKHPKTKAMTISRREQLHDELWPLLIGRIFHVTRLNILDQILAAGAILANTDGKLPPGGFGSYPNSYFRKRGCVSLFDLLNPPEKKIDEHIHKCSPFTPAYSGHNLAFLFLSQEEYPKLVPWSNWKEDKDYGDQIVPYVEAGYLGDIPISSIEEIWEVTVTFPDDNSVAELIWARIGQAGGSQKPN
ncbi:hypothetical protein ACFLQ0_01870 [Nitrospinota bacterium]